MAPAKNSSVDCSTAVVIHGMDDNSVNEFAFANLPKNKCALTNNATQDPVVMHRDLSDWWPPSLRDMLDNRLNNMMIVDREQRDRYYGKLTTQGIVLALSGGLDSTTVLHWCLRVFGRVHCVVFNYQQRHQIEVDTALKYVDSLMEQEEYQGRIKITKVDMSPINFLAPSALTRDDIDVPASRSIDEMGTDIPSTFVPGRNVYFTTALAQVAYTEGWRHVALGANVLDYSGYPDCRPEFFDAMRTALRIGIFNGVDVGMHMPLMQLDKRQIIRLGDYLGVDYANTHSCYNNVPGGCGTCDSCLLRREAFRKCGREDPAITLHQST